MSWYLENSTSQNQSSYIRIYNFFITVRLMACVAKLDTVRETEKKESCWEVKHRVTKQDLLKMHHDPLLGRL
jgi:hypothetical protein